MNKRKINNNNIQLNLAYFNEPKPKQLNRLSGLVRGARADLTRRRGVILKIIPPFLIGLIYLISCWPFVGLSKSDTIFGSTLVKFLSLPMGLLGLSARSSFLILSLFYVISGLNWYFFLRKYTKRVVIALLTVIIWNSPFFAVSLGNLGVNAPSYIFLGFFSLDIAHMIGLSLVPLFLLYLDKFLKKPDYPVYLKSAILVSIIGLISPFALFNIIIIGIIIAFSESMLGEGRIKIARSLLVLITGIILSAFWYHPQYFSFLLGSKEWKITLAVLYNLLPMSFFIIPIAGTLLFLIFDRRPQLQVVFVTISLILVYGLVSFSENMLTSQVASLPMRFYPEFSLGVSLGIAILIANISYFLSLILIKVRKKSNLFLERIPYLLSSFILGFLSVWIIINAQSNNLLILTHGSGRVTNQTVAVSQTDWITGSGNLLSHLIGILMSAVTIFGLYKIRIYFSKVKLL